MILLLVEVVVFAICLIIAKKMVKNRSFLAKRMVIGKDDNETKETLLDIAQMAYLRELHIPSTCEECTITITGKESEITSIKVENERTIIHKTFQEECSSSTTTDKGFSEWAATVLVAMYIGAFMNIFIMMCGLLIFALFH